LRRNAAGFRQGICKAFELARSQGAWFGELRAAIDRGSETRRSDDGGSFGFVGVTVGPFVRFSDRTKKFANARSGT
jgi:hypothetical protein